MKKRTILAAALTAILPLTGCVSTKTADNPEQKPEPVADAKPVILVVSFGTSYNDNREKTIGAIENAIAERNPDYEVRRAFTSQIIIDKLKERDGLEIDNVEEALDRLVADGVKKLVVQPTHVMSGYEYDDLAAAVEERRADFDAVAMGQPLLTDDEDYARVTAALLNATAEYNSEDTAVVFMGHGTEHESNAVYTKLQENFSEAEAHNYFIGTVEATPTLEDVLSGVMLGNYSKVVLEPLMVVAGDHANNDMAGDEEDSWKSVMESSGLEVECLLRGMGEIPEIQQIYADHAAAAVAEIE